MVETLTEPTPPPRWWYAYVVISGGIALAALIVGLFGLYANDRNAARQAECFEVFADKLATSSKEVREAASRVDEIEEKADAAAARRDAAFQKVLTYIVARGEDRDHALALFTRLTNANERLVDDRRELVAARNRLQAVRDAHPIPEAPKGSGRCELIEKQG